MPLPGSEIHTEIHSTDAHSGVAAIIRESGSPGSLTLTSRDIIGITDFSVAVGASGDVKVESITAGGTLTLFRGSLSAGAAVTQTFRTPWWGLRGGVLTFTAPAGNADFNAQGFIQQG